eukprot:gene12486-14655_t
MSDKFMEQIYRKQSQLEDFSVHISKASDFTYDVGKSRLTNVKLPANDYHEKQMYLQKNVDFNNIEMVKATGGLLEYLARYLALDEFETLENLQVNEIVHFSLLKFITFTSNLCQ